MKKIKLALMFLEGYFTSVTAYYHIGILLLLLTGLGWLDGWWGVVYVVIGLVMAIIAKGNNAGNRLLKRN